MPGSPAPTSLAMALEVAGQENVLSPVEMAIQITIHLISQEMFFIHWYNQYVGVADDGNGESRIFENMSQFKNRKPANESSAR